MIRRLVLTMMSILTFVLLRDGSPESGKGYQASGFRPHRGVKKTTFKAYAGIFHFLPLGLRILENLERLIKKHMRMLGASEISLSTLSSVSIWQQSGRHELFGSELFQLEGNENEQRFLLSPTHEEEITKLVAGLVGSYRQLPLRLFQISRKYRNERRPRGGLLRGREFLMKDLYTFDTTVEQAKHSYNLVVVAYRGFFRELGIPIRVVEAQSGAMGGAISHEFQLTSSTGEDEIIYCTSCGSGVNAESADSRSVRSNQETAPTSFPDRPDGRRLSSSQWDETILDVAGIHSKPFLSEDEMTLVIVVTQKKHKSRAIDVKEVGRVKKLSTRIDDAYLTFKHHLEQCPEQDFSNYKVLVLTDHDVHPERGIWQFWAYTRSESFGKWLSLKTEVQRSSSSILRIETGDSCGGQDCRTKGRGKTLKRERSIELAHTFQLGTRYSRVFDAIVATVSAGAKGGEGQINLQMGCHGIGLTRIIAAIAETYRDEYGIRWPRLVAPFEALVISRRGFEDIAERIYDRLSSFNPSIECVIDDRDLGVGERYHEAAMIGYPVVIDIGKSWQDSQRCEIRFRHRYEPQKRIQVSFDELEVTVLGILANHR